MNSSVITTQAAPDPVEANAPSRRDRVLLLAYTCMPNRGSEPGMGWNRSIESAKHFDTWVLCGEEDCPKAITEYLDREGPIVGLQFEFLPESLLERLLKRTPGLKYLGYNLWNRRAGKVAKRLHEMHDFDLVHHVTYCGFREPGYLWKLDAPFVWGPVGGAQNYPWRFLSKAGLVTTIKEGTRSILNLLQMRFCLRVRRAARNASLLLAATTTNHEALERAHGVEPVLFPDTGVRDLAVKSTDPRKEGPLRILWCGVVDARKALHLLIEAVEQIPDEVPWELHVVGSGSQQVNWQQLADDKGLGDRISWLGTISHAEALEQFAWADLFVFTSLRDTTGTVLLEALAAGLPIVCLDHQGGADVVNETCGVKIPVTEPRQVVEGLSRAIETLGRDAELRESLGRGALERAKGYLWSDQGERLAELYRQVIAESKEVDEAEDSAKQSDPSGDLPSASEQEPDLAACESNSFRRQLGNFLETSAGSNVWSLVDQGVVSATRFLTTVLVGRLCGAGELGTYTLAFSLMLLALAAQDSAVMGPFVVYGNRLKGAAKSAYSGSVLIEAIGLSVLSVFALLACAVVFLAGSGGGPLAGTTGVLAVAIPFVLLHQFGRRFAFAELDLRTAFALDLAAAALQLGGLALLIGGGWLSASAVYALLGLAYGLPGLVWLVRSRHRFRFRRGGFSNDLTRNWRLGRWMLASQVASVVGVYVTTWLLAWRLNMTAAGIFAACAFVVCLTNPVLLGLSNVLIPRAARSFAEAGLAGVRGQSRIAMLLLVGITTGIGAVLAVAGQAILGGLYGAEYAAYHAAVSILVLATIFNAARMAADQGLLVLERSDLSFASQLLGIVVTCLASLLLIPHWGVLGAACGPLAGQAVAATLAIVCHEYLTYPGRAAGRAS